MSIYIRSNIPQTALVAALDTYDINACFFIIIIIISLK
jgi:hypothetical protein